jgi:hypothetical protein
VSEHWYYNHSGERLGPVDAAALRALAAAGVIQRHTPLQRAGAADWFPAAQVPGLCPEHPAGVQPVGEQESTVEARAVVTAEAAEEETSAAVSTVGGAPAPATVPSAAPVPRVAPIMDWPNPPEPPARPQAFPRRASAAAWVPPAELLSVDEPRPAHSNRGLLLWAVLFAAGAAGAAVGTYFALMPSKPAESTDAGKGTAAVEPARKPRPPAPPEFPDPAATDTPQIAPPAKKADPVDEEITVIPALRPLKKTPAKATIPEPTVIAKVEPTIPKTEPPAKANPKRPPATPRRDKTRKELIAEAESAYADVFGAEHDATSKAPPAKKVAFAQKLAKAATAAAYEAPELARLLRYNAAVFAESDPSGYDLALAMLRDVPADSDVLRRRAALTEKRALREKTSIVKATLEAAAAWLDAAEDALSHRRFDEAAEAAAKARKASVRGGAANKKLTGEIDEYARAIVARRKAGDRYEAAVKTLADQPDDPKANLTAAVYLLTVEADPAGAAEKFRKAGDPAHRTLAEALLNKESRPLEIADACRASAGAAAVKEDQAVLALCAANRYRAVLEAEPGHADAVRIKLLIAQAPRDDGLPPAVKPTVEMPEEKTAEMPAATVPPAALPPGGLSLAGVMGSYAVRQPNGTLLMNLALYTGGSGAMDRGVNRTYFTWTLAPDAIVIQVGAATDSFKYKSDGVFVNTLGQVMTRTGP